ncbi:hypothetical protein [Pseudosulfitobacter pseudonitzschiae]|uniref:hypothetical protein n=1 Tax=Pseudosulfitobacter pseudonitzschiae TaxID=1402135 RepID=UPI003B80F79F
MGQWFLAGILQAVVVPQKFEVPVEGHQVESTSIMYSYENGGTRVQLHADGTKVRQVFDPEVDPVFPEQMDLKITDWCDAACAWCHEGSTLRGKHGDVDAMISLLSDLPAGVEIAIGGGDPLSHPDFSRLVRSLSGIGLVPNVTVNGRHVIRHKPMLIELIEEKAIYGVGVSFHEEFPDWNHEHLVDHMIAGVDDPGTLLSTHGRKILILGYKEWGRGLRFKQRRPEAVDECLARWFRLLPLLAREHHLSFDNLAIAQLKPRRIFRSGARYDSHYMGREGEYSLYVDGVKQEYATSSYAPDRNPWSDIVRMYQDVRARDTLGF